MKTKYLIIKDNNDKKKTTGTGRISWPYFDIIPTISLEITLILLRVSKALASLAR